MEMNDDVNLTTPENNTKVVETPENNMAKRDIENPVLNTMENKADENEVKDEVEASESNMAKSDIEDPELNTPENKSVEIEAEAPGYNIVESDTGSSINAMIDSEHIDSVTDIVMETSESIINTNPADKTLNPAMDDDATENTYPVEEKKPRRNTRERKIVPTEIHPVENKSTETNTEGEIQANITELNTIETPVLPLVENEGDETVSLAEPSEVITTLHYDNLSKPELLKAAQEASLLDNLRDASDKLKALRPAFENVLREEQQKALAEFIEGGGERDAFTTTHDTVKDQFYSTFETLKKRKEEQRIQIEKQKQDNLKAKNDILDKIKAIVDGEESKDSIEQIKFLQSEWKRIKVIPQENAQKLWDTYSFYIDKFYDNRSIYYELKELDRQKNLSAKIELCLRVDELKNQTSMKQCMILLHKYHEDWKSIGPVPKEVSEELWQRFKGASDIIHDRYRAYVIEQEAVQTVNLQQKLELIDKAREIAQKPIEKGKDWNERSKEYENLLNEWKKIGMVPRENANVWDNFRGIIDEFYKLKNGHFKELNKSRMENYRKKEELCVKAEALKDSTEWGRTSKELVRLQDEWKNIEAVPDKFNESIWKRFRAACDLFFNTKNEKFASQKSEYAQNMEAKTAMCARLEELAKGEDYTAMANEVRAIQDQWNATGHVDIKVKDALYKRYNTALDIVYTALRKNNTEFEQTQNKQRYENIASQQDGKFRLQSESRKLQDRIRILQENIDTLQNNIGFFANSKNAESLKKKVEDDIAAHQKNIVKLKEQLQVLRGLQNGQPAK